MTLREIYRAGITFWFGNHYKLDAYVLRDGKKHPFALICPGGAYMLVSEENEGHTFAVELNRRGISAFVLHYRCRSPLCWCCVIRLSRWVPTGTSKAGRICLDRIRRPIWCS